MVKFVGFLGLSGLVFSNPLISTNDFIENAASGHFAVQRAGDDRRDGDGNELLRR